MRSTKLAAASFLGALALSGCGWTTLKVPSEAPVTSATAVPSPTETAPSTYAWNSACELLDGVDLEALAAEPLAAPYEDKPGRCQMQGSGAGSTAAVELYITSPGGAEDFDYQRQLQSVDHEVAGLGDAAFQSGGYIHVLVGDNSFDLVIIRQPLDHADVALSDMVAAARIVLANTGWEDAPTASDAPDNASP